MGNTYDYYYPPSSVVVEQDIITINATPSAPAPAVPASAVPDNSGVQVPPPPERGASEELPQLTKEQIDENWKILQAGDELFASGKTAEALKQYESAAKAVPQMPDPWVRLAIAQVSQRDYNTAMESCNRSMELSTSWPTSPFALDYMYRAQTTKKLNDLSVSELTVNQNAENSDLAFLVGTMFYFDGQLEKAEKYLNKAKELLPEFSHFTDPMLENLKKVDAESKKNAS